MTIATELILGLDAGGTKTTALLAVADSDGDFQIVGRGSAGPGNPIAVGFETACRSYQDAIDGAFAEAAIARESAAGLCMAVAGAGRAEEQHILTTWASKQALAKRICVVTDAHAVLWAGTPSGCGIALIAGTGSFVFGRNTDGFEARAGGWGYRFGDEGSGYALAVAGLSAVARAADGISQPTALTQAFLHRLDAHDVRQMLTALYAPKWDRQAIADLAGVVLETAHAGDPAATDLLNRAACQLADQIAIVAQTLRFAERSYTLAAAGGVIVRDAHYRSTICQQLAARRLNPLAVHTVTEPAIGAVRLALRA